MGYVTKQYVQNFACQHHGNRPLGKLYVDERLTCIQRILCININIYIWAEKALTGFFRIRKGPKTAPCQRAIN